MDSTHRRMPNVIRAFLADRVYYPVLCLITLATVIAACASVWYSHQATIINTLTICQVTPEDTKYCDQALDYRSEPVDHLRDCWLAQDREAQLALGCSFRERHHLIDADDVALPLVR